MLFPSPEFLFGFLPITLVLFLLLRRVGLGQWEVPFLVAASFVFYGWWSVPYLGLLIGSIVANYYIGRLLLYSEFGERIRSVILFIGVLLNLFPLFYYKYANFAVSQLEGLFPVDFHLAEIVLPIGISFYTFQQIAFIVDAYKREADAPRFIDHALFISFFPQLIAGPIVHHREMMPQFRNPFTREKRRAMMATGIVYFVSGLFKKIVLADAVAKHATLVFDAVHAGKSVTFLESWIGALSYTLQIYFDFSAYSDMALGLGLFFGIVLPINFNSPYKAGSIIEFWQRWHITLSRFLRDYLYIPLGGNRRGIAIRYRNIFLVMVIGGIWHGAGWTFAIWGLLHAGFIIVNHIWRDLKSAGLLRIDPFTNKFLARFCTLLAVIVAWVFFRAATADDANQILSAMFGLNGLSLPVAWIGDGALANWLGSLGVGADNSTLIKGAQIHQPLILIMLLYILCFISPNTHALARFESPFPETKLFVPLTRIWPAGPSVALGIGLAMTVWFTASLMSKPSPFIYFQF